MKNIEKYYDIIMKFIKEHGYFPSLNKETGRFSYCYDCDICMFNSEDSCECNKLRWLNEEYIPQIPKDINIDTPILVSCDNKEWFKRHFAGFNENGDILAWRGGRTSYSSFDDDVDCGKIIWKYAKLYKEGETE